MVQKYISPCTKERKKEEMRKEAYPTSFHGMEKAKKIKNPNYLGLRTRPSNSQIYALKSRRYSDRTSMISIRISRTVYAEVIPLVN